MKGVSKSFGAVAANRGISFSVNAGEIHSLVGENGAGKTTLMRVLYGMLRPDAGTIEAAGIPVHFLSPRDALARGIVMVQQSFALVDQLSVAENVVLGMEPTMARVVLDARKADEYVAKLAARLGMAIDPKARVGPLGAGMRQRVEILKALYRGAKVLILDEPTSLLGPRETEELFSVMDELAAGGTGIVFISHRVREVVRVSHRITVLRKGERVAEVTPGETSPENLAVLMSGGKATPMLSKVGAIRGTPVLQLAGVCVKSGDGTLLLDDVSLRVPQGEILGVAAVEGNGARPLVETVVGLRTPSAGSMLFQGNAATHRARQLRARGMSFVPAETTSSLVVDLPLEENLLLGREGEPAFSRLGFLRRRAVTERCVKALDTFGIVPAKPTIQAGALSGGNKQRLAVARELDREPVLIVAAHPTKGLDVAGADFVHNRLIEERNRGGAVILASSDLDEIIKVSDRIVVLFRGRVVAALENRNVAESDLIPYMTGARTGQDGSTAETPFDDAQDRQRSQGV
jgi:simple sugar transport system ATP-binding protein